MSEPVTVVAIGASAGGLSPIEEFFDALPSNTGAAFVVIQHLSPHHESMMAPLLNSHTAMPVTQAEHGVPIKANCVYLISPGTELAMEGRRFVVRARSLERGDIPKPIDIFFSSLAEHYGSQAVGIVLSGTGSDGTEGLGDIREAGGLTLAQNETAAFEGMPLSAQRSGNVDASLSPSGLANVVQAFIDDDARPGALPEDLLGLDDGETKVLRFLSSISGLAFDDYKPATIHRRLQRRVTLTGSDDLEAYGELVSESTAEQKQLLDDLLIDVTQFFRDRPAFSVIEEEVAPRLISEAAAQSRALRIWVAGCSSGEEAYSIVMIFMEAAERYGIGAPQIQAFATDVHPNVIEKAGSGRYSEESLASVPTAYRNKYFERIEEEWRVVPRLRTAITFATHDLLTDAPFTKIDFASCRNLLIYFRSAAQERAISSLSFSLRLGGVMFLGSSETLGHAEADYSPISNSWRVFGKETESRERVLRRPTTSGTAPQPLAVRTPLVTADHSLLRSYDAVLESQFGAALLISNRRELVHVMGRAGEWLTQPSGRPTLDVLSLVRDPGMRLAIGAVIRELEGGAVEASPRPLGAPEPGSTQVDVLLGRRIDVGNGRFMCLVQMRTAEQPLVVSPVISNPESAADVDLDQLGHLEAELAYTRESLQSALEEQETSNEELNAANEELIASNEELQSTNEELSSVNEELRTLNDEHQRRLDQVLDLTADLEELMSATEIGVVFLAEDAAIRRFNEPARDFFRIRDQDIGRAFEDIRSVFDTDLIAESVQLAFNGGTHSSRAMLTHESEPRRVAVRVSPYQLPRERSGVLIAVVDITDLEIADEERLLARFLRTAPAAVNVSILDTTGRFTYRLRELEGADADASPVGRLIEDVLPPDAAARARTAIETVRSEGRPVHRFVSAQDVAPYDENPTFRSFFPIALGGSDNIGVLTVDARAFEPLVRMERDQQLVHEILESTDATAILLDAEMQVVLADGIDSEAVGDHANTALSGWLTVDQRAHLAALDLLRQGQETQLDLRRSSNRRWQRVRYLQVGDARLPGSSLILVSDQHERMSASEEMRDEIAQLKQQLRDLRESSASDVASLAERNEDLDNFAHVAAHDLKAPIRSIRSFGELAIETLSDEHPARDHVEQVVASAKRMTTLVESLLEYAAIDRGTVQSEAIDLRGLLDDVQLDLRSEIDESDASLVLDLETSTVEGSPEGIRQVLTNLVHNAVKFRGDTEPLIVIEAAPNEGGVLIRVTDNGIGFDDSQSDRLFEPFQRLHATPTPGSGVGLAICRRIVQRHNGRIWATTEPEVGSRFNIWLPEGITGSGESST